MLFHSAANTTHVIEDDMANGEKADAHDQAADYVSLLKGIEKSDRESKQIGAASVETAKTASILTITATE